MVAVSVATAGTAAAGIATADRSVSEGEIVTVGTSTTDQNGAISVEVTDTNGDPVENADVTLYGGSVDPRNEIATGVADGGPDNNYVRFTDLAVGTDGNDIDYVVRVSAPGYTDDDRVAELSELNSEQTVFPVLRPIGNIEGDVVNENDVGVGGADVTLSEINSSGTFELASTTTDSDGSYSFTDVTAGKDYRVTATYTDRQGETFTGFTEGQLENLPQGTTTASIVLTGLTGSSDFRVLGLSGPSRVTTGESFTASAFVKNEGESADTQTVSFLLGGSIVTTQQLSLDAGERQQVEFTGLSVDEADTYIYAAATDDDTQTATLTVEESTDSSDFRVLGLSGPSRVTTGESFTASVFVKNEGGSADTQTVRFQLDGSTVATQQLSLDAGERQRVEFTGLSVGTAGTYIYAAATDNSSQTATLTVEDSTDSSGVVSQYDGDDNGSIERSELGIAAADFANGELSRADLGLIAANFASS